MSYEVRHYPATDQRSDPFLVLSMTNRSVRYFNGRQYRIRQVVQHFIHPLNHKANFTDHFTHVRTETTLYRTKTMRYTKRTR